MTQTTKLTSADVYQTLRSLILSLRIRPGSRITENQLASHFNVSRTPVREALLRLENEGHVKIIPKQGCYVRELDILKVSHYYDVRTALEDISIKEAIAQLPRCRPKIELLAEQWHPESRTFGSEINDDLKQAEEEFHIRLAEVTKNNVLVNYLKDVNDNIRAVRRLGWPDANSVNETYADHYSICTLILSENIDAARDAMKDHIRRSQDTSNKVTLAQLYQHKPVLLDAE